MKRDFDPHQPELMDMPQPVTPELEQDLLNLVSLNRYFGSHRLIKAFLNCWFSQGESYRVLDVCTGAGDIPRLLVEYCRRNDIRIQIDAIDSSESTLAIAKKFSAGYPEINWIKADALTYCSANTYDLVCCSLALHHFSERDAVSLLRNFRNLTHRWILVADLERHWSTAIGVWLVTSLLYREPMTRHDAMMSVRRAFSFPELQSMAEEAGWSGFGHQRFIFCRQALWLSEREFGDIPAPVLPVPSQLPSPA
jgi:SAM-dependent methyltransferase